MRAPHPDPLPATRGEGERCSDSLNPFQSPRPAKRGEGQGEGSGPVGPRRLPAVQRFDRGLDARVQIFAGERQAGVDGAHVLLAYERSGDDGADDRIGPLQGARLGRRRHAQRRHAARGEGVRSASVVPAPATQSSSLASHAFASWQSTNSISGPSSATRAMQAVGGHCQVGQAARGVVPARRSTRSTSPSRPARDRTGSSLPLADAGGADG